MNFEFTFTSLSPLYAEELRQESFICLWTQRRVGMIMCQTSRMK